MNKRAAELGMTHSHFANSRGKSDPSQHVTARDMALLAAHVIRDYPEYYHYFGEKEFTWNKIRQLNRNPLLTMDIGADGLKAGDVADGGFALVGSAVQDGQRLIVVMNGLKSATERAEEARKLFDYGFHSFDRRTLFRRGDVIGVGRGLRRRFRRGAAGQRPSDHGLRGARRKRQLVAKIVYTGPLVAPVEKGKDAARLKIWRGDMLVIDAPLKTGDARRARRPRAARVRRRYGACGRRGAGRDKPGAGGKKMTDRTARPFHHLRGRRGRGQDRAGQTLGGQG